MTEHRIDLMKSAPGFIAALDQSGGSTPKTLEAYGVSDDRWSNDEEMFELVHAMRARIMSNASFRRPGVLGAILFQGTLERKVDGQHSSQYLWRRKGILPFLKIDLGLAGLSDGVQLMKPFGDFRQRCRDAASLDAFGTKMRSVIKEPSESGIRAVVEQQFEYARWIFEEGLVPIVEPEIDIRAPEKRVCEEILRELLFTHARRASGTCELIFKLTLPEEPNFYRGLAEIPSVVRVAALSGGYSQSEANDRLADNSGMIASFSRALTESLRKRQSDQVFSEHLSGAIDSIASASAQ